MIDNKNKPAVTREMVAKWLGVGVDKVTVKNGEVLVDVTEFVKREPFSFRATWVESNEESELFRKNLRGKE